MPKDEMPKDQKIAFCVADIPEGHILILGVTPKAWEYMQHGKTHQFDLTKIGLPFKVTMFGAPTYQEALTLLHIDAAERGVTVAEHFNTDFSIEGKEE